MRDTYINKVTKLLAVTVISATVINCATITRGSTETVAFRSMPSGATVSTTLGLTCTTPCEIEVKRKEAFTATISLNGKAVKVPVQTSVSNGGAATTMGNVLAGGVIGIGVDAATGASLAHYPNPVVIDFTSGTPTLVQGQK